MVAQPQVLALIPARGGSKGIPRKNLRDFAGAPLIAYSIAAALQAETVSRVIVSTDDEEISQVARAWGAEVPFLRPPELAQDDTTDFPVFQHALEWLAQHENRNYDVVVQLRPTSPVRPKGLIDSAVRLLMENPEADSVRGVVPAGQNPYKMWRIDPQSGSLQPLLQLADVPEPYNAPRQMLPKTYWQTGHIDAIRTETILRRHSMSGSVILPVVIDPRYTVDIDTPADLERYARLMQEPELEPVDPLKRRRSFPGRISTLVMDFDGVLSDDMVYTDQDGRESVRTSRSDGLGLDLLREQGQVNAIILSREENPVVSARGRKLKMEVFQAVLRKDEALRQLLADRNLKGEEVIYVGNDVTDLPVLPLVGYFVCPADAHPQVRRQADLVLRHPGGRGAIRELTEMVMKSINETQTGENNGT